MQPFFVNIICKKKKKKEKFVVFDISINSEIFPLVRLSIYFIKNY